MLEPLILQWLFLEIVFFCFCNDLLMTGSSEFHDLSRLLFQEPFYVHWFAKRTGALYSI
jgi:hypothetical protein